MFLPVVNNTALEAKSIAVFDPVTNVEYPLVGPATATLAEVTQPLCAQCAFLRWGNWSINASWRDRTNQIQHVNTNGVWIAGRTVEPPDMPKVGSATYNGAAVAMVDNRGQSYQARGDFTMGWNFASRSGSATISNFDTAHTGGIAVSTQTLNGQDGASFSGVLVGNSRGNLYVGGMNGEFVAGPDNLGANGQYTAQSIPQGVAGSFSLNTATGYAASGIFGGATTP